MLLFLKNLVFTLVVPATVAVYLPWLMAGDRAIGPLPTLVTAFVLFLLGGAIYLRCVWDFAVFGRGTPAPIDAPKRLVVRGLYRYTRNPMYVGVLTMILGWTALFQAPILLLYALAVGTGFQLFVVFYEEPHLRKMFGAEYEDYCSRVGRWLPTRSESSLNRGAEKSIDTKDTKDTKEQQSEHS